MAKAAAGRRYRCPAGRAGPGRPGSPSAPAGSDRPLLARCWELRDNLTIYDASYVALAEAMDVTLLTGDGRLARATGPRCHIEVLRPAP